MGTQSTVFDRFCTLQHKLVVPTGIELFLHNLTFTALVQSFLIVLLINHDLIICLRIKAKNNFATSISHFQKPTDKLNSLLILSVCYNLNLYLLPILSSVHLLNFYLSSINILFYLLFLSSHLLFHLCAGGTGKGARGWGRNSGCGANMEEKYLPKYP